MKIHSAAFVGAFLLCQICHGQKLAGVKTVSLSASEATFQAKKLIIDNMRITSATTKPMDFVRGTFKFELKTQSFVPESYQVFHDIGVYYNGTGNDTYFAIDAATPLVLVSPSGDSYFENQIYSVTTSGQPFSIDLTAGQVLSFNFSNSTADFEIALRNSQGAILYSDSVQQGAGVISGTYPILSTGGYTVTIKRLTGSGDLSLDLQFGNANRQPLTTIGSGAYIQTDLREDLRDYYKYRIHLDAGDELNVAAPGNNDSRLVLVSSASVEEANNTGLGLVYVASSPGDYYLFVDDSRALGTNYYGGVTISRTNGIDPTVPHAHAGVLSPAKRR